jgi:serine/threonine-protein kinase
MLEARLNPSFRYVHEPLSAYEDVLPSLGNDQIGAELQSRLLHSQGGAFLISGFRGVGKSTMVLRVLDQIVAAAPPGDIVIPVWLSVARSTTTERLLFAVVRRVFEGLADLAVLDRLSPETRHALLVAYMRTSLSFKETQSEARERSAGLDLGAGKGAGPIANFAIPKLTMSAKRSHALATEAAFLAYSETDAEYDLMRIVSLVRRQSLTSPVNRSRWRLMARRRAAALPRDAGRLRLIIVLDEVDKLTAEDTGLDLIEELLSGIKNVLTMSGAHFLIVAGPDLHDRAVRDTARGNGVYESVFGWQMYVPCMWEAAERLMADVIRPDPARTGYAVNDPGQLEAFIRYLRFKARGVPRRLLQEFNSYVIWVQDAPVLRIDDIDMQRVEFYARIEEIMRDYFARSGTTRLFPVPIDEDRRRLGSYYVADWVLRSDGEPFSAADLLREGDDTNFDPMLRISHGRVVRVLDHLTDRGILEVVRESKADGTVFPDVGEAAAKVYQLAEQIRLTLLGLAVQHETERVAEDMSISLIAPIGNFPHAPGAAAPGPRSSPVTQFTGPRPVMQPPPIKVLADRYELTRLLGQGGMGSVYAGTDRLTGQPVAVKMLRSSLTDNPQALLRARREAELAMRLRHPQLVQTLDVTDDPDGSPVLVMELLDGSTLARQIEQIKHMDGYEAVTIGKLIADALEYLAGAGVARIDLKPSNIILQPARGPVIIDLGVARDLQATNLTGAQSIVGTPMYMAPELLRGDKPDPRVDIYSLGLVLYYCLVGRNPWEDLDDVVRIMWAVLYQDVDFSVLHVSPELKQVIVRAIDRNPGGRFQGAAEMRAALMATPEWRKQADITIIRDDIKLDLPADPERDVITTPRADLYLTQPDIKVDLPPDP